MPRLDRTGPMGRGEMTGRGNGYCGDSKSFGFRRGFRRGYGSLSENSPRFENDIEGGLVQTLQAINENLAAINEKLETK